MQQHKPEQLTGRRCQPKVVVVCVCEVKTSGSDGFHTSGTENEQERSVDEPRRCEDAEDHQRHSVSELKVKSDLK